MPLSTDNQDYGEKDQKNKMGSQDSKENNGEAGGEEAMTSDNLKGKKVDADPEKQSDQPGKV